jgi:phytanoyl-CoA hydroxylase
MAPPPWPDQYRRHGFATLAGVLDPPTIRAALEHLERRRTEQRLQPGAAIVAVALADPQAAALAADERLTAIAAELLEAPPTSFGFTYLCKPARGGLPALWHQDGAPWLERLAGAPALTMWIALDDSDPATGGLRVIPGSHRLDAVPLRPNAAIPSLFGVEMDPTLVDETLAMDVPLRSGDVSVHHPQLIHGSGPNRSDRPRRALAIRYRGGP